jgi:hypothetical protein
MGGDAYRLLIDVEAMRALGAKGVRQTHLMLSALDYGKVRDVSHLGKISTDEAGRRAVRNS